MPLDRSARCIKYLVFLFNFLFFVCGIALMAVGIYVQLQVGDFAQLQSVKYLNGSILIIVVGAAIAMVSFFGCCGAVKENRCFLAMFFLIVLLVFCAEIAGTAMGFIYRGQIETRLKEDLNASLLAYGQDDHVTTAYDILQEKEKCCGVNSYADWRISVYSKGNSSIVPDSCCITRTSGCGQSFDKNSIYVEGCYQKVKTLLKGNLMIICGVGLGVALIQISAMTFAMMLICRISRQSTE